MRVLIFSIAVFLAAGVGADLALIQPNELAADLATQTTHSQIRPYGPTLVVQVGPNVLYRSKHIPRAIYAGPASRPEGLELLKKAVEKLPRAKEIIVYCGCCPWSSCPNVKPAMSLLKEMGFTNAKAMYVETSFAKDWIDKGYPAESVAPQMP